MLVRLALKLEKLGGVELLARLREHPRTKTLPVVILTSSDEEQTAASHLQRQGVISCSRKLVGFDQFSEAVLQIGLYWMSVNEIEPTAGR